MRGRRKGEGVRDAGNIMEKEGKEEERKKGGKKRKEERKEKKEEGKRE